MRESASIKDWNKMHESLGYIIDPKNPRKLIRDQDKVDVLKRNNMRKIIKEEKISDAGL